MYVLQTTWRSTKLHVTSVHTDHRREPLLTVWCIHGRAPGITRQLRGGQSTSDNTTISDVSPSLFQRVTADVIIADLDSFINSLKGLYGKQ